MRSQPLQTVKSPTRLDNRRRRIRDPQRLGKFEPGSGRLEGKLQPIKVGGRAAQPVRCEAGFSLRTRNQAGGAFSQLPGLEDARGPLRVAIPPPRWPRQDHRLQDRHRPDRRSGLGTGRRLRRSR
jgi:hypothetical protein